MWLACDCLIIINKSPEERVYSFTLKTYTKHTLKTLFILDYKNIFLTTITKDWQYIKHTIMMEQIMQNYF